MARQLLRWQLVLDPLLAHLQSEWTPMIPGPGCLLKLPQHWHYLHQWELRRA